jgi:hypothetical protein
MASDLAPAEGARSSCGSALKEDIYINAKGVTRDGYSRASAALLDVILACFDFTPRNDSHTLIVKIWHDVLPPSDFDQF